MVKSIFTDQERLNKAIESGRLEISKNALVDSDVSVLTVELILGSSKIKSLEDQNEKMRDLLKHIGYGLNFEYPEFEDVEEIRRFVKSNFSLEDLS